MYPGYRTACLRPAFFSASLVGRCLDPGNSNWPNPCQLFEILGWILVVAGRCLPVIFSARNSRITYSPFLWNFSLYRAVQCDSKRLGICFGESFHSMGRKVKYEMALWIADHRYYLYIYLSWQFSPRGTSSFHIWNTFEWHIFFLQLYMSKNPQDPLAVCGNYPIVTILMVHLE